MTQADLNFIQTCKNILENGISSKGTNVRTKWEDGVEANYYSIIGVVNKYDLSKEFPMITIRNNESQFIKAIDELFWIWQRKSNNVKDLNSNIWNAWADETGSIKKAYGFQLAVPYQFKTKDGIKIMDQVDYLLYLMKNDKSSRRMITNIFNHNDLKDMALEPCVYGTQWLIKQDTLHLILNQRSQDMLAANGWNIMQYAALVHMFAHVNDLKVGTLTHCIGDCHIYDRHIPLVEKLIESKGVDCLPKLELITNEKDFYKIKVEDFKLTGYDYDKEMKLGRIPIAI